MDVCEITIGDAVYPCAQMTLRLPIASLEAVRGDLDRARRHVAGAEESRWVSTAASLYRSRLFEAEAAIRQLVVRHDQAMAHWRSLQSRAREAGHPVT